MKVVCAGNFKTGTKSLSKALSDLGFTVYDWEEQFFDFLDHWVDVFQNGTKPDVKRVYKNADAVVDLPGAFFYEEILEAFPDCKVILTERDEDAWIMSNANQFKANEAGRPRLWFLSRSMRRMRYVYHSYLDAFLGSHDPRKTYVFRKRFRIHNERVKSTVPPDKLLVYNIKEGWKPLCDFLECDIPNTPFPHENIKGELGKTVMKVSTRAGPQIKREIQQALMLILAVFAVIVALILIIVLKY